MEYNFSKLLAKSPAPSSRTSESATCVTMSALLSLPVPPPTLRAFCCKTEAGSSREQRHAGAIPKEMAVRTATNIVSESTRRSGLTSSATGNRLPWVIRSTRRRLPEKANTSPSNAPATDSARHSARTWRATDQRLAPIATRTLISWLRAAARASMRLARLTQATSRISPTIPART